MRHKGPARSRRSPAIAPVSAVGRILIALIFVRAGINKLGTIAVTSATMRSHGIRYPDIPSGVPFSSNSAAA